MAFSAIIAGCQAAKLSIENEHSDNLTEYYDGSKGIKTWGRLLESFEYISSYKAQNFKSLALHHGPVVFKIPQIEKAFHSSAEASRMPFKGLLQARIILVLFYCPDAPHSSHDRYA
ncbi:unnamed protein product [Agarophyton chilense]